jgi:hypothetical protein
VVVVSPCLAEVSQGAKGEVSGNGNTQIIKNEVHQDIAKQYIKEDINAPTNIQITNEATINSVPSISMLGIGDAETTFMMYPGEVLSYPAMDNQTYQVRSAEPIAVYVIGTGNDRMLLDSSDSMLTYDPIYHKFEHGVVSPVWIFPHFTTKCSFTTSGSGYIVVDNRYFPAYTMVEIIPVEVIL